METESPQEDLTSAERALKRTLITSSALLAMRKKGNTLNNIVSFLS